MILAIIQARMSSNRLPGKVLKDLAGKPMLQWVIDAAKDSKLIDGVVVATSTMASDVPIIEHCRNQGIYCRTGSLDDVLGRFYAVAMEWRPTHIVRLTADCPLLTGAVIDQVIKLYLQNELRYMQNGYDGLDVEVFPYNELLIAHKVAFSEYDREHVTSYISKNTKPKSVVRVLRENIEWPFSVDNEEQYNRMNGILSGLQSYVVKTRNGGRGI